MAKIDPNKIIELDPSTVRLNPNNPRFQILEHRLIRLMDDILDRGQKNPIEVLPVPKAEQTDGILYQVNSGNYRTEAIRRLNAEKKAGLKLRAVVVSEADAVTALKDAILDNTERENMSAMDCAKAIKQLMDAQVPRAEIRRIFARPTGQTGTEMQPASNSWMNICLSFLDFPIETQQMIHDGRLGFEGGYELHKSKPEKWAAITAKIEERRLARLASDQKDETKFLSEEKKRTEQEGKLAEKAKKISEAEALVESTGKAEHAANELLKAAFQAKSEYDGKDKDKRNELEKNFKEADNAHDEAKVTYTKAKSALAKLVNADRKADDAPSTDTQAPGEAPLPQAATSKSKTKGKGKAKGAGKRDVANAAKDVDDASKPVKRTATEMREGAKSLMILSPNQPKTKQVGEFLTKFFDGEITDGQLQVAISKIVGEYREPNTPKKK